MPYEIAPTTSFTDEEHAKELLDELLEDGHDEDEINIGYDVEEDDLPDQYDDESYIDGLLTTGFHAVDASEMFGEEVVGYSLY